MRDQGEDRPLHRLGEGTRFERMREELVQLQLPPERIEQMRAAEAPRAGHLQTGDGRGLGGIEVTAELVHEAPDLLEVELVAPADPNDPPKLVAAGHNAGAWDGEGIITSMPAAQVGAGGSTTLAGAVGGSPAMKTCSTGAPTFASSRSRVSGAAVEVLPKSRRAVTSRRSNSCSTASST